MAAFSVSDRLIQRLATELGQPTAIALVTRLVQSEVDPAAVFALLDDLEEAAPKAVRAAIEVLPKLDRRAGYSQIISWLDIGVSLAESSGATALKYFKESPLILGVIEQAASQAAVLRIALELAEQDANVTLEFLKAAPQILAHIPSDQVQPWLDLAIELTQVDVVVGLEYIRQIPAVAPVLSLSEVRSWLSFGMKLIVPNTFGKLDYLPAMEFLRTSPTILGDIEPAMLRSKVVSLGLSLAEQAPQAGIAWLAESPRLLRALPSTEWRLKIMQYGSLLVEKDPESTLSYLRRSAEIVALIGEGVQASSRFENWFKAGMEVLAYSPDGARAYFGMESRKALSSVERALSGVSLRQGARKIKLFVQGLCGSEVSISALPDSLTKTGRATVSADGKTIALPALLRRFPTADQNERLYLVMAAHEAGHLEFGTYQLRLDSLLDLITTVRQRYGRADKMLPDTLAGFFRLYAQPRLIHDLWAILEDARVEFLLQCEYPGLKRDLAQLAAEAITPRDPANGLTVKELIVDCLLRLSTGESESSVVPHAIKDEVSILWRLCQPVFTTTATAESTVRLAHEVYIRMEELLAPRADAIPAQQLNEDSPEVETKPLSSQQDSDEYRPIANWIYRGDMNPQFIHAQERADPSHRERTASDAGGLKQAAGNGPAGRGGDRDSDIGDLLGGGQSLPSVIEELLTVEMEPQATLELTDEGERAVRYPEWDATIQDYRVNWCRVVDRNAETGSDEFVSTTLTNHQSAIRSLRRFFESLRPPAFRRIAGQTDGEEVDIDAVVRRAAEQRASGRGEDRIYIRREKRERDVVVAFLVDVSGSTGKQVEGGRRVIDVEKEALVLLCEALEAVGDQYAVFAYSGQGRHAVEILTIKNFDERLGVTTAQRLGELGPRQQNRDGAAIRHAVTKLKARDAKTRILVLLSDGRPLDGDYKDEYSLEDTKAALREARQQGIHPFCVTIDREADNYMRRLYGDVQYAVIDRVESLPAKLPRIYQRLTT